MDIYDEMMNSSRGIAASFHDPHFYESCASQLADSHRIYERTSLVACCREVIAQDLARNPGHGLDHAEKVRQFLVLSLASLRYNSSYRHTPVKAIRPHGPERKDPGKPHKGRNHVPGHGGGFLAGRGAQGLGKSLDLTEGEDLDALLERKHHR